LGLRGGGAYCRTFACHWSIVIVDLLGFAAVDEDQVFRLVGVGLDAVKLPLAVAGGCAFES
jgi:hypothetical protein